MKKGMLLMSVVLAVFVVLPAFAGSRGNDAPISAIWQYQQGSFYSGNATLLVEAPGLMVEEVFFYLENDEEQTSGFFIASMGALLTEGSPVSADCSKLRFFQGDLAVRFMAEVNPLMALQSKGDVNKKGKKDKKGKKGKGKTLSSELGVSIDFLTCGTYLELNSAEFSVIPAGKGSWYILYQVRGYAEPGMGPVDPESGQ